MHFLYVDESGDTGAKPGSSSHFILCGLLIHHASWHHARQATKAMRQRLEDQFGFPQQAELHASEFLGRNDIVDCLADQGIGGNCFGGQQPSG